MNNTRVMRSWKLIARFQKVTEIIQYVDHWILARGPWEAIVWLCERKSMLQWKPQAGWDARTWEKSSIHWGKWKEELSWVKGEATCASGSWPEEAGLPKRVNTRWCRHKAQMLNMTCWVCWSCFGTIFPYYVPILSFHNMDVILCLGVLEVGSLFCFVFNV